MNKIFLHIRDLEVIFQVNLCNDHSCITMIKLYINFLMFTGKEALKQKHK